MIFHVLSVKSFTVFSNMDENISYMSWVWEWLGKIPGTIPAELRTCTSPLAKPVPSKAGTVNPILSPPGGLFISNPFEGGGGGGLFGWGGFLI